MEHFKGNIPEWHGNGIEKIKNRNNIWVPLATDIPWETATVNVSMQESHVLLQRLRITLTFLFLFFLVSYFHDSTYSKLPYIRFLINLIMLGIVISSKEAKLNRWQRTVRDLEAPESSRPWDKTDRPPVWGLPDVKKGWTKGVSSIHTIFFPWWYILFQISQMMSPVNENCGLEWGMLRKDSSRKNRYFQMQFELPRRAFLSLCTCYFKHLGVEQTLNTDSLLIYLPFRFCYHIER